MLYISPFEVLEMSVAGLQEMDKRALLFKKKQLLAELELQQSNTVTIKNREFTRNDIIALFEQLETDGNSIYHIAIVKDPVLLAFLQTGEMASGEKFADNVLYHEPGFVAFVSPFYKAVFQQVILKRIIAANYTYTYAVFANPVFLTGADYDACIGVLHGYIEERVRAADMLKERFAADRFTDLTALADFYNYSWVLTLNSLPDTFAAVREDYTVVLYNFSIDLWNAGKRDTARTLLYGIKEINSGERMINMVKELTERLAGADNRPASTSDSDSGGFRWVWALVMFIVAIVRIGNTCNDTSSRDSFSSRFRYSDYTAETKPMEFVMGYPAFQPQNKRDSSLLYLLNTLFHSTEPNYKNKNHATLNTGDDPYAALFKTQGFAPVLGDGTRVINLNPAKKPQVVEEVPDAVQMAEEPRQATAGTVAPAEERGIISTASTLQQQIADAQKNGGTRSTKTTLLIENKIMYETILFFYGDKRVFSVYLKPFSSYTLPVDADSYKVFGYGGTHFNYTIAANNKKAVERYGKRKMTGIGRFSEINLKMLNCLKPAQNIVFSAIPGIDNSKEQAKLVINFDNEQYFSLSTGHGIVAFKTPQPKYPNDPF